MASGGVDSVTVLQPTTPHPASPNTALSPRLSLRQTLQAGTGLSTLNNFAENQGELSTFQRLKHDPPYFPTREQQRTFQNQFLPHPSSLPVVDSPIPGWVGHRGRGGRLPEDER